MKKIIIVEDNQNICECLKELLENANYEVFILQDFKNAQEEIMKNNPDLILLDINIPFMNGEVLLREIRQVSNVPIIMVTSKDSVADEVLSMSYGADDYITKPYNPTILLLRINAIFKRLETNVNIKKYEDLIIFINKGIIKRNDLEIILTKNEMLIFSYLLEQKGKIVNRDDLMTELWDNNEFISDNTLTVNISRLRAKLKEIGYENAIETRKGQGYILL